MHCMQAVSRGEYFPHKACLLLAVDCNFARPVKNQPAASHLMIRYVCHPT